MAVPGLDPGISPATHEIALFTIEDVSWPDKPGYDAVIVE
jgi:hypothetical protein